MNATDCANYLIVISQTQHQPVTKYQVQCMLYLANLKYQKTTHQPLITEPFNRYAYGPALNSINDHFPGFASQVLTEPIGQYCFNSDNPFNSIYQPFNPDIVPDQIKTHLRHTFNALYAKSNTALQHLCQSS